MSVFVVDDVVTRPGRGEAFLHAYLSEYAPVAEANGLTLVHRWIDPPVWLEHRSNRLLLVWRVAGVRELWAAKIAARNSPDVAQWWLDIAPLVEDRRRSFVADADAVPGLADV